MTVNSVNARLVVRGADRAIEFYQAALGAERGVRYTAPDGSVIHAELTIGGAKVTIKDEDEYDPGPRTLGGSPVLMELDVDDADAVAERMLAAGATVVFPVNDQPYGERGGRLADPFGHLWMISQKIEDLSPEEVQRRTDEMFTGA